MAPLSKIDPVYKEEEEAFKVRITIIVLVFRYSTTICIKHHDYSQGSVFRTPLEFLLYVCMRFDFASQVVAG